jgi:uncharacterized protein
MPMPSFWLIVRTFRNCLLSLCAVFFLVCPVSALTVPALKGRVNDYAQLLSPATISQLENALRYFEQQESTQIVVLIVPTLEGDSLEDFSIRVAENWKIGQKKLDNGAILLIAKQEKKLRIEVGYGLEGKLTDLISGRIIRDVIATQFKQGNFDQGVIDGVTAMMAAVKGEFNVKASPPPPRKNTHKNDPFGLIVPLIIFFGFVGTFLHQKKVAAAAVGAVGSPLLGLVFFGFSWLALLALVAVGLLGGLAASTMQSGGRGGGFFSGSGGFGGGSSDGDSGGFSGGGGDFGGGGASGDW